MKKMACYCSKQVICEDFYVKKWPVKTGGLSSEVMYITNSSTHRNVAYQAMWPVTGGGLFGRLDCNWNNVSYCIYPISLKLG